MSVHVEAWAWEQPLPPGQKLLLIAIADNTNDDGWLRWPQPQLGRMCSMTRPTLKANLERLTAAGLIEPDGDWCRVCVPWEPEE